MRGRSASAASDSFSSYGLVRSMEPEEKPNRPPSRLDCIKYFNALWSCYSPFHQMQNYYRYGVFDNCSSKWRDLVDCLMLRTKSRAEVEEMLMAREKARPHFWTYRTVEEASANWWKMYKHRVMMSSPPKTAGSAAPPPKPAAPKKR
nr:uncharacterized protein LOC109773864 isoform X1 [Aegilops tauschii subsp. strangulata]